MRETEPELSVVVRIDNHDQIVAAYGVAAIDELLGTIKWRLAGLPGVRCTAAANDARHIRIDIRDRTSISPASLLSADDVVEFLLHSIASIPVEFENAMILIAPSVTSVTICGGHEAAKAPDSEAFSVSDRSTIARPTPEWCQSYRDDMRRAVIALEAIDEDRVQLFWQPVRHGSIPGEILYHECLVRIVTPEGKLLKPDAFIPALERIGMMRAFDCYIVRSVLDELRDAPDGTLAANISAQSAVNDAWWSGLKTTLRSAPDAARRLMIEITETAEMRSISQTVDFVTAMRALGCRVALDDFGVGNVSLRQVIALKPDVVKIDAFYVAWAAQTTGGREAFVHMVSMLGILAPTIVVEGIETRDQSQMILDAGGVWQQGHLHGAPTVVRPRFGGIPTPAERPPSMSQLLSTRLGLAPCVH